jgi:hypothetical protein
LLRDKGKLPTIRASGTVRRKGRLRLFPARLSSDLGYFLTFFFLPGSFFWPFVFGFAIFHL